MSFEPKSLDYDLSPYTGLTRDSWLEAAKYLTEGIFNNIKDFKDPVVMPRKETEITYPHLKDSKEAQDTQVRAEIFEGLTRTFFITAGLIHEDPSTVINKINIRDYYKAHVLRVCTESDPLFVGSYASLQKTMKNSDPFRAYQQTVETCALVICLWMTKDEIWDTYTKAEKDIIAGFLSGFAHTNTVPQNWRLFNMLDLAFLKMEGYVIDEKIMIDHAQAIINYYVGDGWYRDGQCFDYYSCWAFNVYAPIWNIWYGYDNLPEIASKFEEYSNKLMETYADFFDKDGFVNMWGRSNIYRNAATSAFEGNFLCKNPKMDPGRARRIASGALLQFITRDDFLYKGVPTLGFYGQFSPLVQGYSCAESPYWLGKAFLCLHLPKDHPFWTSKENNGTWDSIGNGVKKTVLNGPALCFTNHGPSGETILRTGKIRKDMKDLHGMWNYSKLSYNTKYPWEATPDIDECLPFKKGEVESEQFVLKDITTDTIKEGNVTFWCGQKEDVLYRRIFFDMDMPTETHWIQAVNAADTEVPYGILRCDKLRLHRRPVGITFGAYGFADNGTEVITKDKGGAKAVILKGHDHTGKPHQLAMTIFFGWEDINITHSKGSNPDSWNSIVAFASMQSRRQYDGSEPYVLISQVITKESLDDFSEDEIFSVREIKFEDRYKVGAYGKVLLKLADGKEVTIDYEGIEANFAL